MISQNLAILDMIFPALFYSYVRQIQFDLHGQVTRPSRAGPSEELSLKFCKSRLAWYRVSDPASFT
jgi:hypothetical protein